MCFRSDCEITNNTLYGSNMSPFFMHLHLLGPGKPFEHKVLLG